MRPYWAVLVLALIGIPAVVTASEQDIALDLRIVAHATLSGPELDRARETATALLATGGIRSNWRDCAAAGCGGASAEPLAVIVLLLAIPKLDGDDVCGEATRDARTAQPTVLIYVRSIADRVQSIRRSRAGRSHPSLSTLETGHLAGIAIAHEVGHALGLSHASSGVMQARLDVDDFVAWRRSRLAFSAIEGTAMRAAAMSKSSVTSRVQ